MTGKTVLILGGGVGGIVSANALRQRLGAEHRIVVVDKRHEHVFAPSLLWVMVGSRRLEQISKELRRMLRPGIEALQAEVLGIDPHGRRVRTSKGELAYDYLVVAMGADLAPEAMPGYTETTYSFYDAAGATRLQKALSSFDGGRVAVMISSLPFKCPAAPYEAALLLHNAFERQGIRRRVDLQLFTPEALPMPVAGPAVGNLVKNMLEERGIAFHPSVQTASIDHEKGELRFQDGQVQPFDLLVAVPPHRPPQAVRDSALAGPNGWIPVDRHTMKTTIDGVYAIGDATVVTLPNGKPLPKAGVFAHRQAEVVAQAIASEVQGRDERHEFDGLGYCWIEMGGGLAGFAAGPFYAEPNPMVDVRRPGRMWHLGKVLFERYWLGSGPARASSRLGLALGSKLLRVPVSI